MNAATTNLTVAPLPSTSAEVLMETYRNDNTLPNKAEFERIAAESDKIPVELREFDLVFPRAVDRGLFEGGGADRVTDDSICALIWDGDTWVKSFLLAGKMGWGRQGPDHCGTNARLARFAP